MLSFLAVAHAAETLLPGIPATVDTPGGAAPTEFVVAACVSPRTFLGTVVATQVHRIWKDYNALYTDVTFQVLADPKEANDSFVIVRWPGGRTETTSQTSSRYPYIPRIGETWIVPLMRVPEGGGATNIHPAGSFKPDHPMVLNEGVQLPSVAAMIAGYEETCQTLNEMGLDL